MKMGLFLSFSTCYSCVWFTSQTKKRLRVLNIHVIAKNFATKRKNYLLVLELLFIYFYQRSEK